MIRLRRGYAGTSFGFFNGRGLRCLFESFYVAGGEERPHLGDGDVVESGEAFGLWQPLADEHGVEAFEVGEDDELFQRGVVADIPFGSRMSSVTSCRASCWFPWA